MPNSGKTCACSANALIVDLTVTAALLFLAENLKMFIIVLYIHKYTYIDRDA